MMITVTDGTGLKNIVSSLRFSIILLAISENQFGILS